MASFRLVVVELVVEGHYHEQSARGDSIKSAGPTGKPDDAKLSL